MRQHGASDAEVATLTSLPAQFARGNLVALVTIGETVLVEPTSARCTDAIESACVATGAAMGRYLTTVERAEWLKAPVATKGKPGVFEVEVPVVALPDGWRGHLRSEEDAEGWVEGEGEVVYDMEF